jgi:hypothetical protein
MVMRAHVGTAVLAGVVGCLLVSAATAGSFVYEGRLEESGVAATGRYDFEILPYADAALGGPIAATIRFEAVEVVDGGFRLDFDLPTHGAEHVWLGLAVRNHGSDAGYAAFPNRTKAIEAGPIGLCWSSIGDSDTDPAVNFLGTTDAQPLVLRTHNVQSLRLQPSTVLSGGLPNTASFTAGYSGNLVFDGARGSTIAGGGTAFGADPNFPDISPNQIGDAYGAIGGGAGNQVGNFFGLPYDAGFGTIAGGRGNNVDAIHATIAGGFNNYASGMAASIVGGQENTASGRYSTASAGVRNCAGGEYSWAGGQLAAVRPGSDSGGDGTACNGIARSGDANGDEGTFVWSDRSNTTTGFTSTGPNQFLVRAQGGVGVNTNAPVAGLTVQSADKWNPTVGNGWGDIKLGNASVGLGIGVATTGGGTGAVRFWAKGGNEQIVFTNASQYPTSILSLEAAGRVGVRRSAAANALEVEGNASKTTAGDWFANSDARIKTDVAPIENALDRLMRIRPVSFRYDEDYRAAHPGVLDQRYYNVIAQEYAEVFPEAVHGSGEYLAGAEKTSANEVLQVDFHPASVLTLAAVQELAARVELAERENTALKAELAELRAAVTALAREDAHRRPER